MRLVSISCIILFAIILTACGEGGDEGGAGGEGDAADSIAPTAPKNLTATAVSSSQIDLSWTDNSDDEDGFKIERKIGSGGSYLEIATVTADVTTYSDTGLTPGETYYYRVRAYNADGDSAYSNEASSTIPSIRLSASTVSEDAPNNTTIGTFSMDDPNVNTFWLADDAGGRFKIDGMELQVADASLLDYETADSHSITIQASDGALTYSDSFMITVTQTTDIEIHSTTENVPVGGRPAIATDGTNFFLVWHEEDSGEIRGSRITSDGQVLDVGGILIASGVPTGYGVCPSVAFDGTNYLVVWADSDNEVYAVRVTPGGSIVDGTPQQVTTGASSKQRPVSVYFDGTNYLVAWRTTADEIKVARVATTTNIIDDPAGTQIGTGFYPWISFDGTNYLVVWHKWGSSTLDIYGNRISSADGTVIDGTGFVICDATENQDHASVAFDGTNYLVVWHDCRGGDVGNNDGSVYGAIVTTSGEVSGTAFEISDLCRGEVPVTVAFDDTDYLVVWHVCYFHVEVTKGVDVYGQKVSPAGALVSGAIPISTARGYQFGPRVCFDFNKYFIAWSETKLGDPSGRAYGVWGHLLQK